MGTFLPNQRRVQRASSSRNGRAQHLSGSIIPIVIATVNDGSLNYAPSTTPDQLELFFTRYDRSANQIGIFHAARSSVDQPFGRAQRIDAITGFAEGPTISADGRSLYYHQKVGDHYAIYRVKRF